MIGLDWRVLIDDGWAAAGADRGVQGNLDPTLLLGPFERVEAETSRILAAVAGRPGHIFNLGHGVLPETDPAALGRLRELVHEQTASEPSGLTCSPSSRSRDEIGPLRAPHARNATIR